MTSNINYKDTIFEQANLTTIRGKPTFETLHKLRNEIKANAKAVYSNLRRGEHGHLGLVLNEFQYALISSTPFLPNPPRFSHNSARHGHPRELQYADREHWGSAPIPWGDGSGTIYRPKIDGAFKAAYMVDIRKRTTNSINNTMVGLLTHTVLIILTALFSVHILLLHHYKSDFAHIPDRCSSVIELQLSEIWEKIIK